MNTSSNKQCPEIDIQSKWIQDVDDSAAENASGGLRVDFEIQYRRRGDRHFHTNRTIRSRTGDSTYGSHIVAVRIRPFGPDAGMFRTNRGSFNVRLRRGRRSVPIRVRANAPINLAQEGVRARGRDRGEITVEQLNPRINRHPGGAGAGECTLVPLCLP